MISFHCLPRSCPGWLSNTLFCLEAISVEALIMAACFTDAYFKDHPPNSDIGKRIWNTYNKVLPPKSFRKFTVLFLSATSIFWCIDLEITIRLVSTHIFRYGFFKALPLIGQDLAFFSISVLVLGLFYAWIYEAYRREQT